MARKHSPLSDNIQKWLQVVTGHLISESLAFVKLCFYTEIDYVHYESINSAMKLFNHLLEHCCGGDETKALQIFINALKHVGCDLRGSFLIEILPNYGLSCPSPLKDEDLPKEAQFCLCLVKIGTKSRGIDLEERLIVHFCRPPYLNMHFDNIHNLPDLFVRLMQKNFIQWNKTDILVELFESYHATQCLKYLNQYYTKVGLPQLPSFSGGESGK